MSSGTSAPLSRSRRWSISLKVIATASRPETQARCLELGAHAVIDHSKPLAQALKDAGHEPVDFVAALTQTGQHDAQIVESLKPQGAIGVIDDMAGLDVMR